MKFSGPRSAKSFGAVTPININFPVCKSISHFNWFARYDVRNQISEPQHDPKISSAPGLKVNVCLAKK